MRRITFALCLAVTSMECHAGSRHPCDEGQPNGTLMENASPENNLRCQTLGRAFCLMEEDRNGDQPKEAALDRAATWLASLGATGSHQQAKNTKPLLPIADFVYGHEKMPPWTAYWYSVYTCGFNKRVPPEQAAAAAPKWDAAALKCVHDHPGEGDGSFASDALRICLNQSMDQLVAAAPKPPKK